MKEKNVEFDVQSVRKDFPMLKQKMNGHPLVYLDSAATLHKPKQMIDRLYDYYTGEYGKKNAEYEIGQETKEQVQKVREQVAEMLNAEKDEIIFTKNTTSGINLVAKGFQQEFLQRGDEVLITIAEHHANIVPWQVACEQTGSILKFAPVTKTGELDMEAFEQLLTDKVKIVSISHSSHVLGTIFPIKQVVKLAHARKIPVFVDGAQAAPHMPVDVQDLNCDFYAFSAHKMGGPTGVGVLYGKKKWLGKLPPAETGGQMAKKVSENKTTFKPAPDKFEAGTGNFADFIAFGATLDYAQQLGQQNIADYEQRLLKYGTERISKLNGVRIIGTAPEKEPLLTMALAHADPEEAMKHLAKKGIATKAGDLSAQPLLSFLKLKKVLRISFAYFNTEKEIDFFAGELENYLRKQS